MPSQAHAPLALALTLGLAACGASGSDHEATDPTAEETSTAEADGQTPMEITLRGSDGQEHVFPYDEATLAHTLTLPDGEYEVSLRSEQETLDFGARELRGPMTLDELVDMRAPRALDDEPRQTAGQPDLPEGRGEVGFALDTGSDQMGQTPREAGLQVWARWREGGLVQTVASCGEAGYGEPPPTDGEFVAGCDGESVRLSLSGSTLVVTHGAETRTIALPDGVSFRIRDR